MNCLADQRAGVAARPPITDTMADGQRGREGPLAEMTSLFDHLVGECDELVRNGYAECLCGFQIYHKPKLSRLLDRQVGGLGTFENTVDVVCTWSHQVARLDAIRHQTCRRGKGPRSIDCGKTVLGGKADDGIAVG